MKHIVISILTVFLFQFSSACNSESNSTEVIIDPPPGDGGDPPTTDSVSISFVQSEQSLGNTRSFGIVVADVDLDGDNDIFVPNYINASLLWINDGEGSFTLHNQRFGSGWTGTHAADIGDINGDSYPDIILASHDVPSTIYLNSGSNSFTVSTQQFGGPGEHPHTVQLADVDGDGDLDAYFCNGSTANRMWLNDGNGSFTMKGVEYSGRNSYGKVLADFNGDSFPDMYLSYENAPSEIWLNDASGNFTNSGYSLNGAGNYIHYADVDGDGDIDIVSGSPEITIWQNENNTGRFTLIASLGEWASRSLLFDADGDGDCDLISTSPENGNKLWINDSGTFISQGAIFGTASVHGVECADLNSDNKLDVVLGLIENSGGNKIFFNTTE